MRKNQWPWLVVALVLLCGAPVAITPALFTSFPDILFGQVYLSREFKPLSPLKLLSAELLLDQVAPSEIESAAFIALGEDVLFWEPYYPGFPRTELTPAEIAALQGILSEGTLFRQTGDGVVQCIRPVPDQEPKVEPCQQGQAAPDQFIELQWQAQLTRAVGVLQFKLSEGRLAEIRVYPSEGGLAYEPFEKSGDWWLRGLTTPSALLEQFAARTSLPPIPVLWPELSAEGANARASKLIGKQYRQALQAVLKASAVQELFGEIQEIRPAAGVNQYSSWMDARAVLLTFRVVGAHGQGLVLAQGLDCYDLRMNFQGRPVNDGSQYLCP
jgi:hypothetical protein